VRDAGRSPTTPALVVSRGTLATQRSVQGTLADIAAKVRAASLETPAILYVGEVVTLRDRLRFFDNLPLFGKRVLVGRAPHQAASTSALLRRRGAEPVEIPLLRIEAPPDPSRVARAVDELATYDVVAFTSDNGVSRFFDAIAAANKDARAFGGAAIAAIGDGTASALAGRGVRADLVPTTFRGEELAEAILDHLVKRPSGPAGARVLVPRALVAREVLPDTLRARGVVVDVVPVYETRRATEADAARLRELVAKRGIDIVLATSSSTVDALVDALGQGETARAVESLRSIGVFASIGDITTNTAQKYGIAVDVTAKTSTLGGLVTELERHVQRG
jgi:uroporphyrinogen III methyltransferase/synthase